MPFEDMSSTLLCIAILMGLLLGWGEGFGIQGSFLPRTTSWPTAPNHKPCTESARRSFLAFSGLRMRLEGSVDGDVPAGSPSKDVNYKISSITDHAPVPPPPTLGDKVLSFIKSNWLVIGEVLAIILASKNPSIGVRL